MSHTRVTQVFSRLVPPSPFKTNLRTYSAWCRFSARTFFCCSGSQGTSARCSLAHRRRWAQVGAAGRTRTTPTPLVDCSAASWSVANCGLVNTKLGIDHIRSAVALVACGITLIVVPSSAACTRSAGKCRLVAWKASVAQLRCQFLEATLPQGVASAPLGEAKRPANTPMPLQRAVFVGASALRGVVDLVVLVASRYGPLFLWELLGSCIKFLLYAGRLRGAGLLHNSADGAGSAAFNSMHRVFRPAMRTSFSQLADAQQIAWMHEYFSRTVKSLEKWRAQYC